MRLEPSIPLYCLSYVVEEWYEYGGGRAPSTNGNLIVLQTKKIENERSSFVTP